MFSQLDAFKCEQNRQLICLCFIFLVEVIVTKIPIRRFIILKWGELLIGIYVFKWKKGGVFINRRKNYFVAYSSDYKKMLIRNFF